MKWGELGCTYEEAILCITNMMGMDPLEQNENKLMLKVTDHAKMGWAITLIWTLDVLIQHYMGIYSKHDMIQFSLILL